MNVSYQWLRELAPGMGGSAEEAADRLGMLGAPVEEVTRPGAGTGDIVVARLLKTGKHPNADRLSLCEVDPGNGEALQVVCGAPNLVEGALYPFAPVGSSLPGGMKIRKAKIRGEVSNGMLCSERELGLGRAHEGIMRLPDNLEAGESLVSALHLDDVRLTLEITPNRPDLLSHVGVARELAPDGHHGVELPPFPQSDSDERTDATMPPLQFRREGRDGSVGGIRVRIDDPDGCPRYMAVMIEGVTVGPSPDWLAGRLRAIGQRPINNVVDATNYILHEVGQPLHAFDADRLGGDQVRIRRALEKETIVTLDHMERELDTSMLVIADAERPVAVAGVMGGAESEVGPETSRVLLECAYFDPRTIRPTARDLGLSTDASYRYERGVDVDGMALAAHRAAELIQMVAGGTVEPEALDLYPEPREAPLVKLRPSRVTRVLGEAVDAGEVERLLTHIGFELRETDEDALVFAVPGFRAHDVSREADLIEEVARRFGYDQLSEDLRPYRPNRVPDAPGAILEDRVRRRMADGGMLEARSVPMAPEGAGTVALQRPLSAEEGMLRSTIVHGLLRAVERNMSHGIRDVRLFEIGTTFHATDRGERPREERRVGAVLTGGRSPRHWTGDAGDFDVWDARGLLEELAAGLSVGEGAVAPLEGDAGDLALEGLYRPGTVVALHEEGRLVGVAGQVDSDAVDTPAWAAPVFAVEVTLTEAMAVPGRPSLTPVPTQPPSDRDLALLVPRSVPAADVAATIREAAGSLLEALHVFDVYAGAGLPEGTRSIAYRLVFRDPERTLKDEQVDAAVGRVLNRLKDAHGVKRRG